jgi:hypothetical protein
MIPDDGGGRRPRRQAPSPRSQRLCVYIIGERTIANTGRVSTNPSVLVFFNHSVTTITAEPGAIVYRGVAVASIRRNERGFDRRGRSFGRERNSARSRLRGMVRNRGPRADLPQRGERARRLRYFPRVRAPRSLPSSVITGRETPYAPDHGRPAGCSSAQPALRGCARTKSDSARRGRVAGRREVDRRRSPWARAGKGTNCTPSLHDIVRRPDCLAPVRLRPSQDRQDRAR